MKALEQRTAVLGLSFDMKALRAVLGAYVATRLMVFLIIYVSSLAIPVASGASSSIARPRDLVLDGLVRWDSGWYLSIVTHGYTKSSAVFFPIYPLLVKALAVLIHNVSVAGVLLSNSAFSVALVYLYALARREFDDDTAARAVLYLAAAPAAVFFSALYAESLFVALVLATFYYARQRRWGWAALAGALGAATRNTGVFLAAVIALEGLYQYGVRFRPRGWQPAAVLGHVKQQLRLVPASWRSLLAAAFVPVGLLAYMAYLSRAVGDPLAFIHGQGAWERNNAVAHVTHVISAVSAQLGAGAHVLTGAGQHTGVVLLNALVTLAFAPLVVAVGLKMRPAYAVFAALTFLVPLIAGHGVISMIRYVLMLVPCFILLAYYGRRTWVDRLTLVTFLPLMAYVSVTFSHNYQPV
jgi:Mannosyltransferase (PIG-V)